MAITRDARPLGFSRRVTVETPEHVALEFELAGLGSRVSAALVDLAVQAGIVLLIWLLAVAVLATGLAGGLETVIASWVEAVLILVWFVVTWGYFTLFEGFTGGRTPGKRRLGVRVVMDTGHPVTFGAAAIRNLLRIVDAQPLGSHLIGLVLLLLHRHHRRLGDIVAGTIVVRDQAEQVALAPEARDAAPEALDLGAPLLPDASFRVLERVVSRLDELDGETRLKLAPELARRLAEHVPFDGRRPETFLVELYRDELAKRRAKTATRRGGGEATVAGSAERFVALRQGTWEAFRRRAQELQGRGLTGLPAADVTAFARAYRGVAADLARARTYGVDPRVVAYLERVVGAGHNAVYGLRGVRRVSLWRLVMAECPAAVYRSRVLVALACLLFVLPGIVGYGLIRERPELAVEILPFELLARAEAAEHEQAMGRGYAETPSPFLPVVASSIIANNVQVAFGAFALGATAGIGTVLVLLFNGLFFGSVLGVFVNYGQAGWILTFVAGHGVLELTAIFIAGAAGLLIGRTIVAPGDLARRDALIVHGKTAIRLVGASASLLLLAGLIEGFLSASPAPAALKLGVSAASAGLGGLYFVAGRAAANG